MKNVWKKLLSVAAAALVALTGVCTATWNSVPVSAETVESWFIPSEASSLISAATRTGWGWDSALTINEIADNGGLQFVWKDAAVARRQGFAKSFKLDGLTLRFSGLQNTAGQGGFSILLQESIEQNLDPVQPEAGVLALIAVDLADGEIRYENDGIGLNTNGAKRYMADGTVLLKDNALTCAALEDREFTIGFAANEAGGFDVKLTVGETVLTGTQPITAEMLANVTRLQDTSTVFVGVAPGRDNSGATSLNLTGIGPVRKTDIAKTELTPDNVHGENYWPAMLSCSKSATGGLTYAFTKAFRNIRLGVKPPMWLDGMYLKLDNLTKTGYNPRLGLIISQAPNAEMVDGAFCLVLDTDNGVLKVVRDRAFSGNAGTVDTIIQHKNLQYAHLMGRPIVLRSFRQEDGSWQFSVQIGNEPALTGSLTAAQMALSTQLNPDVPAYLTLTPGVPQNAGLDQSFSVDVVEYWSMVPITKKALTTGQIAGENYWPTMLNSAAGPYGGIRYTFTDAFANVRQGVNTPASMDGLYLKLHNLVQKGSLNPRLALIFSQGQDVNTSEGMFCLVLDTENGVLKALHTKDMTAAGDVILEGDALKYAALSGRTLLLRACKQADGGYRFTLQIGTGDVLTGSLTAEQMAASTGFNPNADAYLTVTPGVNQNGGMNQAFSVEVVELWSQTRNAAQTVQSLGRQAKPVASDGSSALRFGFSVANTGVTYAQEGSYQRALTNAQVTVDGAACVLKDFGAVVTNKSGSTLTLEDVDGGYVRKVSAEKLYAVEEGSASFTVLVTSIPSTHLATEVYARSYVVYTITSSDGTVRDLVLYGDIVHGNAAALLAG